MPLNHFLWRETRLAFKLLQRNIPRAVMETPCVQVALKICNVDHFSECRHRSTLFIFFISYRGPVVCCLFLLIFKQQYRQSLYYTGYILKMFKWPAMQNGKKINKSFSMYMICCRKVVQVRDLDCLNKTALWKPISLPMTSISYQLFATPASLCFSWLLHYWKLELRIVLV